MFANESRGSKFPPMAPYANGSGVNIFSAPDAAAIYPEYLTDLNIAKCPSDAGADAEGMMVADRLPTGALEDHLQAALNNQDIASANYFRSAMLGRSYFYFGYAMTNVNEFYGIFNATGTAAASGPIYPAGTFVGVNSINVPVTPKNWDVDIPVVNKIVWMALLGTGFGSSNTATRLKEGVERFVITDINNPAGSALAQSNIVAMFDTYGNPADNGVVVGGNAFNHMPGGCSVLYMDGHAAFVRYKQAFPVVDDAQNQNLYVRMIGHYGLQ